MLSNIAMFVIKERPGVGGNETEGGKGRKEEERGKEAVIMAE